MKPFFHVVIPGRPTSKGNSRRVLRTRAGRPFVASSASTIRAEAFARADIGVAARALGLTVTLEPVIVNVDFVFAIPAKARATVRKPAQYVAGDACMRRVDRGNLLKLVEDAMQGIVYVDDSQIVDGRVRKLWGDGDETRVWVLRTVR